MRDLVPQKVQFLSLSSLIKKSGFYTIQACITGYCEPFFEDGCRQALVFSSNENQMAIMNHCGEKYDFI